MCRICNRQMSRNLYSVDRELDGVGEQRLDAGHREQGAQTVVKISLGKGLILQLCVAVVNMIKKSLGCTI